MPLEVAQTSTMVIRSVDVVCDDENSLTEILGTSIDSFEQVLKHYRMRMIGRVVPSIQPWNVDPPDANLGRTRGDRGQGFVVDADACPGHACGSRPVFEAVKQCVTVQFGIKVRAVAARSPCDNSVEGFGEFDDAFVSAHQSSDPVSVTVVGLVDIREQHSYGTIPSNSNDEPGYMIELKWGWLSDRASMTLDGGMGQRISTVCVKTISSNTP
jgi:hypothetical protein